MDEVEKEVRDCLGCDDNDNKWSDGYRDGYRECYDLMHEDIASYAKTGHGKRESWDLGSHILRDLEYNIPIMLKNLHGTPMTVIEMVFKERHSDMLESEYHKIGDEERDLIEEETFKRWKKMLEDCLLNVRLYIYYAGEMPRADDPLATDDEIKFWKAFDEEWRSSIPKTSSGATDWSKLIELEDQYWDRVWDFVKKHGRDLWD